MNPSFKPAWWLPGAHLQTLWASFLRTPVTLERTRERLWLADGDFIDLDWHGPHDAEAPLVLLLHGLTGSSSSHYILGQQQALAAQGFACVALNWRGCSGEPNLLPRGYHCSNTSVSVARNPACRRRWQCRCRFAWITALIVSAWAFPACIRRTLCAS